MDQKEHQDHCQGLSLCYRSFAVSAKLTHSILRWVNSAQIGVFKTMRRNTGISRARRLSKRGHFSSFEKKIVLYFGVHVELLCSSSVQSRV